MTTQSMANNMLHRYLFKDLSVRGELVQLDDTYQQMISSQEYPAAVQHLIGELLVATSLLTATLKFEGSITLQLQGNGLILSWSSTAITTNKCVAWLAGR